ncbi:10264_t:CDS:2, partial [Dentiscutata erythropus]
HDNDHENNNISTTSKRSNGSEVWDFFKKVVWQKEKKTAKYSVLKCPYMEFSFGHGGSTRTLWRHLEGTHWAQYIETEEYHRKKKKTQNEYSTIENLFKDSKNLSAIEFASTDNIKLWDIFAT